MQEGSSGKLATNNGRSSSYGVRVTDCGKGMPRVESYTRDGAGIHAVDVEGVAQGNELAENMEWSSFQRRAKEGGDQGRRVKRAVGGRGSLGRGGRARGVDRNGDRAALDTNGGRRGVTGSAQCGRDRGGGGHSVLRVHDYAMVVKQIGGGASATVKGGNLRGDGHESATNGVRGRGRFRDKRQTF